MIVARSTGQQVEIWWEPFLCLSQKKNQKKQNQIKNWTRTIYSPSPLVWFFPKWQFIIILSGSKAQLKSKENLKEPKKRNRYVAFVFFVSDSFRSKNRKIIFSKNKGPPVGVRCVSVTQFMGRMIPLFCVLLFSPPFNWSHNSHCMTNNNAPGSVGMVHMLGNNAIKKIIWRDQNKL